MTPKPELSSFIVAEATPEQLDKQWAAIEPRLRRRRSQSQSRHLLPLSIACVASWLRRLRSVAGRFGRGRVGAPTLSPPISIAFVGAAAAAFAMVYLHRVGRE